MTRIRTPKPGARYYLPKYQYRTVVNFCFQYRELKDQLQALDGWHSKGIDGMPHGNGTSDPVANEVIKREEIIRKIEIIENAVRENTNDVMYPYMIKGITEEECTYNYLANVLRIPMGKNAYTVLKRKIYYDISKYI